MKAIITIGVSGSGKSTWAESQKGFVTICRDDVRRFLLELDGKDVSQTNMWRYWSFKREKEVTEHYWVRVEKAAKSQLSIILADTNLNSERRFEMIKRLGLLGYKVELKTFDISYEEAVKRDRFRLNSVGSTVIWKQYLELYGETYVPPVGKTTAIIVDIDGTLAHMNGRSPFEWHRVGEDSVNTVVRDIVNSLSDKHVVIIMSGRDGVCLPETEKWIQENDIIYNHLYMRTEGDSRKDSIVKQELFDAYVKHRYNVVAVFDDRPQVCRVWQLNGLKVFACADQLIEF